MCGSAGVDVGRVQALGYVWADCGSAVGSARDVSADGVCGWCVCAQVRVMGMCKPVRGGLRSAVCGKRSMGSGLWAVRSVGSAVCG